MNERDTGLCPVCGGNRPEHSLSEWRNCKHLSREQVMASALHWGVDMRSWEEPRIQQIVEFVNGLSLTPFKI